MNEFLKNKKAQSALVAVALNITFLVVGIFIGWNHDTDTASATNILGKDAPAGTTIDFSPFWKAWTTIDEKYPGADKVTAQKRLYGAISGLIGSLDDPYSVFFTPKEAKSFQEDISGNFVGVGMEVELKNKILTVVAPLKDTPAYKAGIKTGDKILKIDKKPTADLSVEQAIKLIRGEANTSVTLSILHEGETTPVEIKLARTTISIPTLEAELRSDGIFVIRLYSFSAKSGPLFKAAMEKFADSKSDKLILDLRGNPGGYLDSAVDISSWLLPAGKTVVTEDYGNGQPPKVYRSKGYDILNSKIKFIILIDGGSASASEIVAGAMQDQKKALLVGDTSFGKGSVQEVVRVMPETLLKITVAKWLTPNGTSISEKGLTPNYKVELSKADAQAKKDPQLDKAVSLLKNWPGIK
jgi:carboxyl-terminal processing protease